jgi:hypothetical protein
MALPEEQIKRLLEWFATESETRRKWSGYRKKAYEENHKWIQPDVIREMPDNELGAKYLEYYKSGGKRQNLNQIHRARIIRDKKRFRDTMLYLLDEGKDVKERIDQILKGKKYRIEGFGKAIATSFLMDFDISKYCLWNNKTEMGFSVIGWELYERKDSPGGVYLKVLEALKRLKGLRPELNFDFDDIDLFLHTISAEAEGKKIVKQITQGVRISRPPEGGQGVINSASEGTQGTIRSVTLKAKVPWDKMSYITKGVIAPLKEKGLPPEITIEIKGMSEEGFDRDTLENKVKETLQHIGATIEKWEEE